MEHSTPIEINLGTFEGFNFRTQEAIDRTLTAAEVISWNHDRAGEAEFWPSGDRPEVQFLYKQATSVTGLELKGLIRLLTELGGDSTENFLRIHYALSRSASSTADLEAEAVEECLIYVFIGSSFTELRRAAAFELFETLYPELYGIWEETLCHGLRFDADDFLDEPGWWVEEVELGNEKALLVAPD